MIPCSVRGSYTDALIEAHAPGGSQLGVRGLLHACESITASSALPDDPAGSILSRIRESAGSGGLDDDATIIAIRHHGGDPPRLTFAERARVFGRLLGLT